MSSVSSEGDMRILVVPRGGSKVGGVVGAARGRAAAISVGRRLELVLEGGAA